MKKINLLLLSLLFYTLTGFGISLTILANVGVSSFNSLNLSLATVTSFKIGTMTTIVNALFLLFYIYLTKGKLLMKYLVQAISVLSLGQVINFFTYHVFATILLTNYSVRLVIFMLGSIIAGFGTGMVLNLKLLAFPIESVCHFLSDYWQVPFAKLRYAIDIISVSLSVAISLLYQLPFFVREGTVISLILLTLTISMTKKIYESFFHKQQMVEN